MAVLSFFVIYPNMTNQSDYQLAWFRSGFETFPVGMVGFFFAAILAIHISTVAGILNLGSMYATRDIYHHYINPEATEKRVVWILPAYGVLPDLPDYVQFWLLMALVAVIYFPITLLTKPDDMERLVRIYVQTRPIGFWGPVKQEAERRGLLEAVERIDLKAEAEADKGA